MSYIEEWNRKLDTLSLTESLRFVIDNVKGKKVFSTSFGIEDQAITHALNDLHSEVEVFTLDTGRLFDQTYEVFAATQRKYKNIDIQIFTPDEKDAREYVRTYGINGFYDSVENRKRCCHFRKVIPLGRALEGAKLWITGLRAEQSENRSDLHFLEWDEKRDLLKFNPLLRYTLEEVETFVKQNKAPINSLYKQGFVSIGCAPCTRAIEPGEDFRAGRWWWEQSQKECGIHGK